MILWLYYSLCGYVEAGVKGFSIERFLNIAASRSIYLWDVRWEDGMAVFKVSVKGFKLLRPCARKTRSEVRIIRKLGLPFVLFKYRKRKALAFGVLFFAGMMVFLTSFIWRVSVVGNKTVETEDIIAYLSECGVKVGGLKFGLNLRLLENMLMLKFKDIAWVGISLKGTSATITLAETIPKTELVDKNTPCSIYAKKDGLIVSMATSAGAPLVRPGDVVRSGDKLVSGELSVGSEDTGFYTYYVHARSEIKARMYYEFEFDVPLVYTIKTFTGNIKRNYGIILFDKVFYLENTESPFVNYDKVYNENRLSFGEDYPLPVVYFTETYKEFINTEATRTPLEAEEIGREMAEARARRECPAEAEITDSQFSFAREEDYIRVFARITTIERIDETRELAPETPLDSPEMDGTKDNPL